MKKKISIDQLRPGMRVVHADRGWLRLPFFRMKVRDEEAVASLKRLRVNELVIDLGSMPERAAAEADSARVHALARQLAEGAELLGRLTEAVASLHHAVRRGDAFEDRALEPLIESLIDFMTADGASLMAISALESSLEHDLRHCANLAALTVFVSKARGDSREVARLMAKGALLHDIGKALTPAEVLRKPGKLTLEEARVVQGHVAGGSRYLKDKAAVPHEALLFVREHHERMNGLGYPHGLKGDAISWPGRLGGVLDVYDALVHESYYKDAADPGFALKLMARAVDDYFDGEAFRLLQRSLGPYPPGSLLLLDTGELAVSCSPNPQSPERPMVALIGYSDGSPRPKWEPFDLTKERDRDSYMRTAIRVLPPQDVPFEPTMQLI